eukprot:1156099-Pelagomonas_calceolata.AAC.4
MSNARQHPIDVLSVSSCRGVLEAKHFLSTKMDTNRVRTAKDGGPGRPLQEAPAPWKLPLLGSSLYFSISNPHKTMLQLAETYGPVVEVDFGVIKDKMVLVSDPEAVRSILKLDNSLFIKGPGYSAISSVSPHHLLIKVRLHENKWHAQEWAAFSMHA